MDRMYRFLGACRGNAMLTYQAMEGRIMNTNFYTFLLVCSVLLGGCGHARQSPEDLAREKKPPEMIQIQNLTLTDKTLTLDYRVSNPFEEGIWVCYDIWVHGKQDVQDVTTRIDGETVWIELSFNIESEGTYFVDPRAIAKYVRLRPGESFSGRILLDLPIGDYSREPGERPKEHKQIVLHRAVFEIGYLRTVGLKWKKLRDSLSEELNSTTPFRFPKCSNV